MTIRTTRFKKFDDPIMVGRDAILKALGAEKGKMGFSRIGVWDRNWDKLDDRSKIDAANSLISEGIISIVRGRRKGFVVIVLNAIRTR